MVDKILIWEKKVFIKLNCYIFVFKKINELRLLVMIVISLSLFLINEIKIIFLVYIIILNVK